MEEVQANKLEINQTKDGILKEEVRQCNLLDFLLATRVGYCVVEERAGIADMYCGSSEEK